MTFKTTTEYLYDVYKISLPHPIALIKKHPDGYVWHTFAKWDLGNQGKKIRHRSPVYETSRDALANLIGWFERHKVSMPETELKVIKHLEQNGTDKHRVRNIDITVLSMAERLISQLEPIPERILAKPQGTVPQKKQSKAVPKTYGALPQLTASR